MTTLERLTSKIQMDITNTHLELIRLKSKVLDTDAPTIAFQQILEYNILKERLKLLQDYENYINY